MYNLLEYSSNYSETTVNLWFYSKDEATNFNTNTDGKNNFKCFKYNTRLIGNIKLHELNGIL